MEEWYLVCQEELENAKAHRLSKRLRQKVKFIDAGRQEHIK